MRSSPADNDPTRPGALAWGGTRDAPEGAYSSCEFVEQILGAAAKDADRVDDLLEELAQARLWVPLPADGPVTDGSAVALPATPARSTPATKHCHASHTAGWPSPYRL